MKRRRSGRFWMVLFVVIAIAIAIYIFLARREKPGAGKVAKNPKANILLITLDTTRPDRLGCYGYAKAKTPEIDRIAQSGVIFENAYSPVPLTLPSHASILTGTYPLFHGLRNNGKYFLPPQAVTLAEIMKNAGYATAAFVSSFILDSRFGLGQGFDVYDDRVGQATAMRTLESERRAEDTFDSFKPWLEKNAGRKFFAWVHFFDPHAPYDPPEPFRSDKNFADLYDAEIGYMDRFIGEIVRLLERFRIDGRTLVVLAGDHGEAFGEHGENGHTFFGYEENIRVPLSISMSGSIPKGLKVQTPINLIDIVPTILDFVEIEMPGFVQGRSVLPLAAGRKMSSPPIYFETHFAQEALSCAPLSGILDGHFKYIRLPKPELYDLGTDRMEKKNLLPAEAARGRAMESALKNLEDESAKGGFGSVRVMSDDERRRLASLGYLSAKGRSRPSHLGIDPKDKIEFWNKTLLGKQLLETRKLPEAESLLHGLFRVDPGFGPVIEDLMELYFQAGRRDKIQEILKAGMAADPGNSALRIKGAIYLVRLNLPQKAVEILVDAEKNVEISDKAQFYYVLGNAYGKMAKYAEAEAVLEKALGVEPDNLEILRLLGHCRLQLGDYREALSFFRKAETGMAGDPRLLEDTAMALANLKDYAGAKPYFEKAVRANPSAQIYANYALVYAEEKDYPRAAALMETALRAKDLDETLKTACLAYLREWAPRLK